MTRSGQGTGRVDDTILRAGAGMKARMWVERTVIDNERGTKHVLTTNKSISLPSAPSRLGAGSCLRYLVQNWAAA